MIISSRVDLLEQNFLRWLNFANQKCRMCIPYTVQNLKSLFKGVAVTGSLEHRETLPLYVEFRIRVASR